MRPGLNTLPDLWTDDGSLRDIYVQRMEAYHWELFDTLLRHYTFTYAFEGNFAPFPGSRQIFANREGSHLLSVMLGDLSVNCHFFVEWQLELDISPKEIFGEAEHNAVLEFVEQLSLGLGLPADITPENSETQPFLTYSPTERSWTIHYTD